MQIMHSAPNPTRRYSLFGVTLEAFRERAGFSQSKLAELAGFDHSYMSRLERGGRNPTRPAVDRLAAALELDSADTIELTRAAGFLPREEIAALDADLIALSMVLRRVEKGGPRGVVWGAEARAIVRAVTNTAILQIESLEGGMAQ